MNHHELLNFTFFRGRVGLCKILNALDIGTNDEVITQAYTCVAVPEGILASGATPVYVDIDASGYTLDPLDLERVITKKTRALIVQHTFGIPADMKPILEIANKHNLVVIEDCCHTVSSQYSGKTVGTFGEAAFYSFEYGKPYPIGAGGSVVTSNRRIEKRLQDISLKLEEPPSIIQFKIELQSIVFRNFYTPSLYWFLKNTFHKLSKLGIMKGNYNPLDGDDSSNEFSWRMGKLAKKRLGSLINSRTAKKYDKDVYLDAFRHVDIETPKLRPQDKIDFVRFPICVRNKKLLLDHARSMRVEVADWYRTPIHPLEGDELAKVNYCVGSCPNAEQRAIETVSLPMRGKSSKNYLSKLLAVLNSSS